MFSNAISRAPITRSMIVVGYATLAALATTATARAQSSSAAFEIRPFAGAYLPTGDQRDFLRDAVLVGGQLSWAFIPQIAVTGTFGWAPSKDRITAGDQKLDVLQYDVGAEVRGTSWKPSIGFTPFAGLGLGGRTYSYRDLDVDSKTNFDGYGAVGGDVGFGPLGVRFEARDYVSQFKPLTGGGDTKTRNDITLALGLAYRF